MSLPSGIVLAWPNSAPIPAGWTRVPELDGRFPKQLPTSATTPGTQGGVSVHTHADAGHGHTGTAHLHSGAILGNLFPGVIAAEAPYILSAPGSGVDGVISGHAHQIALDSAAAAFLTTVAGWGSAPVLPPYLDVVWIVSGGRWTLPSGAAGFFADPTIPSGMGELVSARGLMLRGALPGKSGGASGGGTTHAHASLSGHAHTDGGAHTHAEASAGPPIAAPGFIVQHYAAGATPAAAAGHTHALGVTAEKTADVASTLTGPAASVASTVPKHTQMLHVQVTQPGPMFVPIGLIALFRFGVDTLGAGWRFCDGSHGTPDLTAYYFAQGAAPGGLLTQGGSDTHGHTAATHSHPSVSGHLHSATLGNDSGPIHVNSAVQVGSNASPHAHPAAGPDTIDFLCPVDGLGPTDSQTQPLADATGLLPSYTELAYVMFTGHAFTVGISAPTVDEVESTPTPTVAWTLPGGRTQAHYQVSILDAAQAAIIWTSGWTAGVTASIAVPTGILQNLTSYYAVVDVDDTLGDYGESALVSFSVVFVPSAAPTGLAVVQFGGDTVPPALPGAQLSWDAFVPTGGEVWQHWNVYRRVHGTTDWTLLTTLADSGARGYTDYTVSGSLSYDYKLSYTITRWTVYSVESAADGPVTVAIGFTGVWLHVVSDPTRALRYDASGGTTQPVQDQKVVAVWGRRQPTVHVGLQHWQSWTFTGVYRAFPDISAWTALFDLGEAAQQGAVLSVRFGNTGEAFYGIIDAGNTTGQRTDEPFGWASVLVVNEVYFDGGN